MTLAQPPSGPNGRAARPWRWLLIASIVLNVFLMGAVGAGLVARHGHPMFGGHDRPRLIGMPGPHRIRAALPAETRPVLDGLFEQHRAEMRAHFGGLIDARRAVAAAVRAEPFDRPALEAALAALRAREDEISTGAQAMLVDLAAGLDASSRERLAALIDVRRRHSDRADREAPGTRD